MLLRTLLAADTVSPPLLCAKITTSLDSNKALIRSTVSCFAILFTTSLQTH
ncbi:hypothetical protein midi_00502 [Candidatus Midichloria mitochondrii IricVA]|uniref:Uncharacterized protein n=1 Tax=Midichloria mitochondrii (strain IricVA) TaxID=696127 RepID=F7XVW0_MIDMI|nr:hypothetical protein midi_00502 [Candidatus Midichloria mitochondrii IricVA]